MLAGDVELEQHKMWTCTNCDETTTGAIAPALCEVCGALDSFEATIENSLSRAVPATSLLNHTFKRIPSGDKDLDELLAGGFAQGTRVLAWGRGGCGKSRATLRWSSKLGKTLALSLEMHPALTAQSALGAGAELDALHIIDTYEHFEAEARAHRARVTLLDSISDGVPRDQQLSVLQRLKVWAESTGGIAIVICHANKRGSYAGRTWLEHWPEYLLKFAAEDQAPGFARVSVKKSRFCPKGSALVPIVQAPGAQ